VSETGQANFSENKSVPWPALSLLLATFLVVASSFRDGPFGPPHDRGSVALGCLRSAAPSLIPLIIVFCSHRGAPAGRRLRRMAEAQSRPHISITARPRRASARVETFRHRWPISARTMTMRLTTKRRCHCGISFREPALPPRVRRRCPSIFAPLESLLRYSATHLRYFPLRPRTTGGQQIAWSPRQRQQRDRPSWRRSGLSIGKPVAGE